MSLFAILHKREECVGCGLCAEHAPDYWRMNDNGEAELVDVWRKQGPFDCARAEAEDGYRILTVSKACPVSVIRIQ